MMKKVAFADAVGMELAHDVTEIRPGEFKGAAFRRGHVIQACDCGHFQRLGKENFYQIEMEEDEYHENDAAEKMAHALSGTGVSWFEAPHEGKIALRAKYTGLLQVQVKALTRFNMVPEVMCATQHTHNLVQKGDIVAATRAIPLVVKKKIVDHACQVATDAGGILQVKPLRYARAGLVITGNEVYHGRIEDRFEPILRQKVEALGSTVVSVGFAPDDKDAIADRILDALAQGADLILTSGGMSVDPDDVTREAIRAAGAERLIYGSAVLPGAMFLIAHVGAVPVLGIPACGLYHRITVLDLILPRILAGESIAAEDIAALGHGGLCLSCEDCIFPRCGFGKGT